VIGGFIEIILLSMAKQVSETTIETHAAEEEGVLASLGLNTQLFAFQLINFIIVFFILWYLILKPLTKKMEERKKLIDDSIDKAHTVEEQVILSQQKFQC
jgi:large-conductance mechanosensitive channel